MCGNQVLERDRGEDCDTFAAQTEVAPPGVTLSCGAPTEPRACLYTCDPATSGSALGAGCPVGWVCSAVDATCRRPSLGFTAGAPTTVSVTPEEVAFADFDGSGLHDLAFFAGSDVVIRYATGGGGFGPEYFDALGLAGVGRSYGIGAAIGPLDAAEGPADLVAPTAGGALVLNGSATQALVPVPYPAAVFPIPLEIARDMSVVPVSLAGVFGQGAVFIAHRSLGRMSETLVFPTAAASEPLTGARLPAPDAPGPRVVAVADLDRDGNSELAIGQLGERMVRVATVRPRPAPLPFVVRASTVTAGLQLPLPLHDTLVLEDFDGDGDRDLIAEVRDGDRSYIAVVRYDASAGRFEEPVLFDDAVFTQIEGAGVLAIGDVDFDGRADVIVSGLPFTTSSGERESVGAVILSVAGGRYTVIPIASDQLIEAVLGDFNRDGLPDVAATQAVTPGIGVFLGSGVGLFNPSRVETTAFAHTLRVGDFDGDFVQDLLFIEEPDGVETAAGVAVGSSAPVRIQVAFGRSQGAPAAPVSMGEITRPQSIEPAFFLDVDLVSDVLMLTSDASAGPLTAPRYGLFAFRGASDRRLRATLGIAGPGRPVSGMWVGRFDDQPGLDLLAFVQPVANQPMLGEDVRPPLWGLAGDDLRGGNSEAGHPVVSAGCESMWIDTDGLRQGFVSQLTLDGSGDTARDVLVRFGLGALDSATDSLPVTIVHVQLGGNTPRATCQRESLTALQMGEVTRAQTGDLDADGRSDLILVQGDPLLTTGPANGVTVRWSARLVSRGDRARGLEHDGAAVIAAPSRDRILDVALRDLDQDGRVDLVAVTYRGVYVARQQEPRTFGPFEAVVTEAAGVVGTSPSVGASQPDPLTGRGAVVRIFAEDFDGDALADLLVIRDRTIQPYRGQAVAAGGGRTGGSMEPLEPVEPPPVEGGP